MGYNLWERPAPSNSSGKIAGQMGRFHVSSGLLRGQYEKANVPPLPGSYLARDAHRRKPLVELYR
jgi:hypothetical protein